MRVSADGETVEAVKGEALVGVWACIFDMFYCFLIFFRMLPADAFPNTKDGINSKERFLHEMDASMAFRCFAAV